VLAQDCDLLVPRIDKVSVQLAGSSECMGLDRLTRSLIQSNVPTWGLGDERVE
jgi:hypothetical protein